MCWPDSSEIESSSLHNSIASCVLLRVYLRATGRGYGILNLTNLSDVIIATSQIKKFAFSWLSPNQYDRFKARLGLGLGLGIELCPNRALTVP